MKVSIVGVTGYSGLELVRILRQHPQVEIRSIHSQTAVGQEISVDYPHLKGLIDLPIESVDPEKIMAASDLVFFATPSGISKEMALPFIRAGFPVIDLSGDFRLKKAGSYQKWYGKKAAPLEFLQQAVYGLAEFRKDKEAKLVANPGCYATAALLSLAPLVQKKLIEPDSIIVDAKSGLSGAGKKLSSSSHFIEVNENMTLYKMNTHQHIPEIMQQLQKWDEAIPALQFSTSLIPVSRGIFATTYVRPKEKASTDYFYDIFSAAYAADPFIRIQEKGHYPVLKQVIGSNFCDIGLAYNQATNILTMVTVIDNLVKGAAGQAVQNLNIIGGYPQEMGLRMLPVYP